MATTESTMRFRADISDLRQGIADANRHIRSAQAEFNAVASSMENWQDTTEGVEAKIRSLTAVQEQERAKLENLRRQLELTARYYGENSTQAENLRIRINNQQATLNRVTNEISQYRARLGELETASDNAAEALSEANDTASNTEGYTVLKGAMSNLVSEGIEKVTEKVVEMVGKLAEAEGAYNSFSAKTGISAEEMEKYKAVIDELYKDGYGADRNEIANTMAIIKQQTDELDPTKLKKMTENAMVLSDTFGYDTAESIRAVNMLVYQFGITSSEAYGLIVQGAQQGLDKNGDLLDSINEYSVHFSQQGYSASEFLNSLKNGTEAGAFSVDKLGDAMKEFGIRVKDTATSTTDAFSTMGYSDEEISDLQSRFAEGGDSAQEATKEVIEQLFSIDDAVKRNAVGVGLFGTMWEDLGEDGIRALTDVKGEISTTAEALEEVKNVKYDDVSNELTTMWREIETDFIKPIVDKAIPEIKEGIEWVKGNLDTIIPVCSTIAGIISGMWVTTKVGNFIGALTSLVSPAGGVTLAIAGVATAIGGVVYACENSKFKLPEGVQEHIEKVNKMAEAYGRTKDNIDTLVKNNSSEFQYYQDLHTELQNCVTKNGEIKTGYEDRVDFITNTLSKALDIDIEKTGNVLTNYQNINTQIDKRIKLKQAENVLTGYEASYTEAIQNKSEAQNNYNDILSDVTTYQKAKTEKEQEIKKLENQLKNIDFTNIYEYNRISYALGQAKNAVGEYEKILNDGDEALIKKLETAEASLVAWESIIDNYSSLSSALMSEDEKDIENAMLKLQYSFITAETGSKLTLEQQVENLSNAYSKMLSNSKVEGAKVSKQELENLKALKELAQKELDLYNKTVDSELNDVESSVASSKKTTETAVTEWQQSTNTALGTLADNAKQQAQNTVDSFVETLTSNDNTQKIFDGVAELKANIDKAWKVNELQQAIKAEKSSWMPDRLLSNPTNPLSPASTTNTTNYNITQNITAPQGVSPLEIYKSTQLVGQFK